MGKKDTLILFNSIPFFLPYFNRANIIGSWSLRDVPLPVKFVRKFTEILGYSQEYWFADWKYQLESIDIVIIFAETREFRVIEYIKKYNPNIRIIYWYWNPVSKVKHLDPKYLKYVELWSFDPDDCAKFNMKFNTTFYFKDIKLPNTRVEYDVFFLGINKGRRPFIDKFEKAANNLGLSTYFHVVADDNEDIDDKYSFVSYEEYLKLLSKTKAIFDIIPKEQSGLTLRSMESIFFKKKLITTDVSIISQYFYNKQNIFILGHDDNDNLFNFVNSQYIPIDDAILNKYDLHGWLDNFKN